MSTFGQAVRAEERPGVVEMYTRLPYTATLAEKIMEYSMPVTETGCWLWLAGGSTDGYGHVWLKGSSLRAHRVSYQEFVGEIPDGMFVLHTCDTPPCVNPEHLFLGTHEENMADMVAKGRSLRGPGNPHAYFSEETVLNIVEEIRHGTQSLVQIAKDYGTSKVTIGDIRHGITWGWLTGASADNKILRSIERTET